MVEHEVHGRAFNYFSNDYFLIVPTPFIDYKCNILYALFSHLLSNSLLCFLIKQYQINLTLKVCGKF